MGEICRWEPPIVRRSLLNSQYEISNLKLQISKQPLAYFPMQNRLKI